jgi:hypothetical protein
MSPEREAALGADLATYQCRREKKAVANVEIEIRQKVLLTTGSLIPMLHFSPRYCGNKNGESDGSDLLLWELRVPIGARFSGPHGPS